MAAPSVVESLSAQGSGTLTVNTASTTAVDDFIFAMQLTLIGAAHQTAPTTGTWTTLGTQANASNVSIRIWYRPVTVAGAQTVSIGGSYGGSFGHELVVAVVRNVEVANPLDASAFSIGSATASYVMTGVTTVMSECLLLAMYGGRATGATASNFTPPGSMTELQDLAGASRSQAGAAAEALVSPGATGTRTITTTQVFNTAGALIAIRPAHIPINVADSATGSDNFTVAGFLGATDSAAGTETFQIAAALGATDTATGSETFSINVSPVLADSAHGTETFQIDVPNPVSLTDSATGSEAFGITVIQDPIGDSATGTETFGIQRQSTVADSAAGTESFSLQRQTTLTDSAHGSEEFSILEIPFTRVLPIQVERIYEVVVVARIPQASGPPTFIEVDPIEWSALSYKDTIGQAQGLDVTCKPSSLTEEIRQRFRDLKALPTELWLKRSGQVVFAGPVLGGHIQDQSLQLTASGLLTYLDWMGIDDDATFAATDQALVVKSLIDAWQGTSHGNFGIDTASVTASGRLIDAAYVRNEMPSLTKIVTELGVGGFDLEIDPASRKLIVWSPQRGADRSTGEDAIVLDSRNVTSTNLMFSVGPADIASDVFGTGTKSGGDAPLWSTSVNEQLRAQFGRTLITRSWSNVADQDQLDALTAAVGAARSEMLRVPGPKVSVTPDADVTAYREGDTVFYDMGGELGFSGAFRIRSRTVTVDGSGQESVDLEPV